MQTLLLALAVWCLVSILAGFAVVAFISEGKGTMKVSDEAARLGITAEMIEAAAVELRRGMWSITPLAWTDIPSAARDAHRMQAEQVLLAAFRARKQPRTPQQGEPGIWQEQHDREAGLVE